MWVNVSRAAATLAVVLYLPTRPFSLSGIAYPRLIHFPWTKNHCNMTCEKKSTKKSPAYGRGFKPNFSVKSQQWVNQFLISFIPFLKSNAISRRLTNWTFFDSKVLVIFWCFLSNKFTFLKLLDFFTFYYQYFQINNSTKSFTLCFFYITLNRLLILMY